MIPRPVAAPHKDLAPHHAAAAAAAPATAFDFLQLLGDAQLQTHAASNATTSAPATPATVQAQKSKISDGADANAMAALAALAQQPKPQTTAATALANPETQAQAAAATTPHPAQALPAPAAAGAAATNKSADQNGQTVPLPPGAAAVEARVVQGALTYVSQPSAVLAGLWHHAGEVTPQTPQALAERGNAGTATNAANEPPTQSVEGAKTAALGPALAAASHAASAGGSVASAQPDADPAAGTAVAPDANAATPAGVAAPTTIDTPAAAPAGGATGAPVIVTPAHILPAYEQVAISLKQAAQTGSNRIEIQLKPASLGAISVKLDVTHDGHITAVISADRSDTLHMLRQDSAGLQQALRDAGLQADAGSLSFNLRGDPQSFAQNTPQPPAPSSRTVSLAAALPDAPVARTRAHSGALDIEV